MHDPTAYGLLPLAAALALMALWMSSSASPDLVAAINGLRLDVGGLGTQLHALDEKVGALTETVGEQGLLLREHSALLREHGALLREHGALLREHGAQLNALTETAVTPDVGARLEACGRASVVAAFTFLDVDPARVYGQCSAVPLPEAIAAELGSPGASTSTYFLTAAHCFMKDGVVLGANVTLSYLRIAYLCRLVESFIAPPANATPNAPAENLDLAILRCPFAVPVAPTRLSSIPYAAHTPAVLIGFARGLHLDHEMTAGVLGTSGVEVDTYAMHTKVSRLSSSFQAPFEKANVSCGCCAQGLCEDGPPPAHGLCDDGPPPAAYLPAPWSSSLGFLELSPWGGMSGGAVMDTHCGVFGITERRSLLAVGGMFIRLVPEVLQRIGQAIRRLRLVSEHLPVRT